MTNPNFVYQAMQSLGDSAMSSCGKTKGKPWPGLGKKVDVMTLPCVDHDGVEKRLEGMTI